MTKQELITLLCGYLPEEIAGDLVANFLTIREDTATATLERAAPGKFVETVVQALQYLDAGHFDESPKVDDYLKNLESKQSNLQDNLRLAVARVSRGMYTLRNKRNILHKGAVDTNIYDLRYLFFAAQWVLSELVRHVLATDMATAGKAIEFIQIPVDFLVEDFGNRRLVLKQLTAKEELLVLLRRYYPEWVPVSQIYRDMDRRPKSTISNTFRNARKDRLIEGDTKSGYKLTIRGFQSAQEIDTKLLSGNV